MARRACQHRFPPLCKTRNSPVDSARPAHYNGSGTLQYPAGENRVKDKGVGDVPACVLTDPAEIVEAYSDMVLRAAYGLVKNTADAEDVTQEVFLSLLRATPSFESAEHQKAWLLRTTVNKCKDHFKSAWQRRTQGLDETLSVPFTAAESTVIDAVRALPMKYRTVVYLYYIEGYSAKEIAALLGVPQNTVLSQMSRARKMLKETLKGDFDDV